MLSSGVFYAPFPGVDTGMVNAGSLPASFPRVGVWLWLGAGRKGWWPWRGVVRAPAGLAGRRGAPERLQTKLLNLALSHIIHPSAVQLGDAMWCSTTAAFPSRGGRCVRAGGSVRGALSWLLQSSSIPEMLQVLGTLVSPEHAATLGDHLPCERPHGQHTPSPFYTWVT